MNKKLKLKFNKSIKISFKRCIKFKFKILKDKLKQEWQQSGSDSRSLQTKNQNLNT